MTQSDKPKDLGRRVPEPEIGLSNDAELLLEKLEMSRRKAGDVHMQSGRTAIDVAFPGSKIWGLSLGLR